MKTAHVSALRIQRAMTDSETTIDTLIAQSATLVTEMATARVDSGVPAETGHLALAAAIAAQAKMMEARRELLRAHKALRGVAETMDMPTECPEFGLANEEDRLAS